jgi:FdhD protein
VISTLDVLVEEAPVSIGYAGIAHATFMATPEHLDELAVGFSITEGIALCADHVRTIDVIPEGNGYVVDITLSPARHRAFVAKHRTRGMRGRRLRGVFGVRDLADTHRTPRLSMPPCLPPHALRGAIAALRDRVAAAQEMPLAAFADPTGAILAARADIDRHNALDKLVGTVAQQALDPASGFCLVSGHCTYEMIQQIEAARFSIVVALRAPTALAVRAASEAGVTLLAMGE